MEDTGSEREQTVIYKMKKDGEINVKHGDDS